MTLLHSSVMVASRSHSRSHSRCCQLFSLWLTPQHQRLFKTNQRSISSAELVIHKSMDQGRFEKKPAKEDLKFGTTFSDHMLTIAFQNGSWQPPEIRPYQELSISPAASSLHYGLACFEGMKAYKSSPPMSLGGGVVVDDDNHDDEDDLSQKNMTTRHADTCTLRLFRPDKNMERLKNSMERLQMPGYDFDPNELIQLIKTLIQLDERWIPEGDGFSLYIRPTVIATHPFLGLAPPTELLLYVITCPVGPYYPSGFQPVTLWATPNYVRAWPGGTGCNKVGGNYAPTMKPQAEAIRQGLSQVLWLFGDNHQVTEVGGMNVFFVIYNADRQCEVLVTPPLTRGDILPGVTRDSILVLAKSMGLQIEERFPTMEELIHANRTNCLREAFGAGTAAVVTPIEGIHFEGEEICIPATGPWTQRFWDTLTGIQSGRIPGPDGWSVVV